MSDRNTHATIRASADKLIQLIDQSSLEGETEHGDLYLNILPEEVQILQQTPGESVLTYCSFTEDYFDALDVETDVEEKPAKDYGGGEFEYTTGTEVLLDVSQTLTYLGMVTGGGTVELEFYGTEERRLSQFMEARGSLTGTIRLPGSRDILDDVPHWLPNRFTDEDEYTNKAGDAAPTRVETKAEKVKTIIQAVKNDRDAEYYPITVDEGDFFVDVGDDSRDRLHGSLAAQMVEGPDVENYYYDGFEEIFSVLAGPVSLHTAPNNSPLSIVQSDGQGRTIRHVNGSVNT